jgi:hypothetical protein
VASMARSVGAAMQCRSDRRGTAVADLDAAIPVLRERRRPDPLLGPSAPRSTAVLPGRARRRRVRCCAGLVRRAVSCRWSSVSVDLGAGVLASRERGRPDRGVGTWAPRSWRAARWASVAPGCFT